MNRSYSDWSATVVRTLIDHGVPVVEAKNIVTDNEEWFVGAFHSGESAVLTADEWFTYNEE